MGSFVHNLIKSPLKKICCFFHTFRNRSKALQGGKFFNRYLKLKPFLCNRRYQKFKFLIWWNLFFWFLEPAMQFQLSFLCIHYVVSLQDQNIFLTFLSRVGVRLLSTSTVQMSGNKCLGKSILASIFFLFLSPSFGLPETYWASVSVHWTLVYECPNGTEESILIVKISRHVRGTRPIFLSLHKNRSFLVCCEWSQLAPLLTWQKSPKKTHDCTLKQQITSNVATCGFFSNKQFVQVAKKVITNDLFSFIKCN